MEFRVSSLPPLQNSSSYNYKSAVTSRFSLLLCISLSASVLVLELIPKDAPQIFKVRYPKLASCLP